MKKVKLILYPILAFVIILACFQLFRIKQSRNDSQQLYQELAQQVNAEALSADSESDNGIIGQLKEQNPDSVAWIRVDGTNIDYPVLQSKDDAEYYLTHDFYQEESNHGAIFLDTACDLEESENLIIYGHHMKDGSMFQNLTYFEEEDFFQEHSTIELISESGSTYYTIYMVMVLSEEDYQDFPYYQNIELSSSEIMEGFLARSSQYALWNRWDRSTLPERLMTLSTCEYSHDNGRLVIVAGKELDGIIVGR